MIDNFKPNISDAELVQQAKTGQVFADIHSAFAAVNLNPSGMIETFTVQQIVDYVAKKMDYSLDSATYMVYMAQRNSQN